MAYKLAEALEAEALLLGRVTYEGFAAAWPEREDPRGFADRMNRMPKFVASSTLEEVAWENSTLIQGDAPVGVAALKEQMDGPLPVAGSRTLVHTLLAHGLADTQRFDSDVVVIPTGRSPDPRQPVCPAQRLGDRRAEIFRDLVGQAQPG
jgi:dihydrofolate reductase